MDNLGMDGDNQNPVEAVDPSLRLSEFYLQQLQTMERLIGTIFALPVEQLSNRPMSATEVRLRQEDQRLRVRLLTHRGDPWAERAEPIEARRRINGRTYYRQARVINHHGQVLNTELKTIGLCMAVVKREDSWPTWNYMAMARGDMWEFKLKRPHWSTYIT